MFVVELTNMMILFSVNLQSSVLGDLSVLNFESVKKIQLGDLNLSAMTLLSKHPTDLTFLFNWQDNCFSPVKPKLLIQDQNLPML